MASPTIVDNVITIKSSNGRYYKIDRVEKKVHIYANEDKYNTDDAIGSLPMDEFKEVFEYVRDVAK
jgi:hypothetical protein